MPGEGDRIGANRETKNRSACRHQNLLWTGLRAALDGSADITVLDDAVIQLEASDAGAYPAPDVVVISADLAGSPAIERMRALRERWVRSHVVVLAPHFR